MTYKYMVTEKNDIPKIDKLNKLTDKESFWEQVRKLTKRVSSDHAIRAWQALAEARYNELIFGVEDIYTEVEYGKPTRYFSWKTGEELFLQEV